MIDIERVKKGDILITEEVIFGMSRLSYGPVIIIDRERNEIGIKVREEIRSFLPERLSTIYTFVNNCRAGTGRR